MAAAVGDFYTGKVTGITKFGAFIQLENGETGLCHISEVSFGFVKAVEDHLKVGDPVKVKVLSLEKGKMSLSIKDAMPKPETPAPSERAPRPYKEQGNFREQKSFNDSRSFNDKEVVKDVDPFLEANNKSAREMNREKNKHKDKEKDRGREKGREKEMQARNERSSRSGRMIEVDEDDFDEFDISLIEHLVVAKKPAKAKKGGARPSRYED